MAEGCGCFSTHCVRQLSESYTEICYHENSFMRVSLKGRLSAGRAMADPFTTSEILTKRKTNLQYF